MSRRISKRLLFGQYAYFAPIKITNMITEYVMRSVYLLCGEPLLSGVGGVDQFAIIFDFEDEVLLAVVDD